MYFKWCLVWNGEYAAVEDLAKRENERRWSLALSGMTDNILLLQQLLILCAVVGLMNLSDHPIYCCRCFDDR